MSAAISLESSKTIIICGFRHGGTNILWNILQSHPSVYSPGFETGEILRSIGLTFLPRIGAEEIGLSELCQSNSIDPLVFGEMLRPHIGRPLDLEDCQISDTEYNRGLRAVTDRTLCLKSVDDDLALNRALNEFFGNCNFVGLVRNGYAICESWLRNGGDAKLIGKKYRKIGEALIAQSETSKNFVVLRFEDVIEDIFVAAKEIYKLCSLSPVTLRRMRLKVKPVRYRPNELKLKNAGYEMGRKYWMSRSEVREFVVRDISNRQEENLSSTNRSEFEGEAGPILKAFGYW